MKFSLFTIMLTLIFAYSFGQIQPGEYFNYAIFSEGEKLYFFPDNHMQIMIGNDTIVGSGANAIGLKYMLDSTKTPNWFDLFFYDIQSGEEINYVKGLYVQNDMYSFDIALGSDSRPEEINYYDPGTMRLTLNSDDNYIKLLQHNEQNSIQGFSPEIKTKVVSDNKTEITYLQNGKPIQSKEFQSKEIQITDDFGKLIEKTLYNEKDELFINQYGYCKKVSEYDAAGNLTSYRLYKNENELIDFNGTIYPRVEYSYKDGVLSQIDRLINNDSLKHIYTSTTKFIYDSYGDLTGWEDYFSDGTKQEDTLKVSLIENLNLWINNYALYPASFELLITGNPAKWSVKEGNKVILQNTKYDLYAEFFLNDSSNIKQKFTGFFQFNYKYDVIGIAFKSKKTGSGENLSWFSKEYDNWFAIFGRELTETEKKANKQQKMEEAIEDFEEIINEMPSSQ